MLAVVAAVAVLYVGREFFVPLVLGVVLAALLAPIVGWLRRHGVPAAAGAALVVLTTLALVIGGAVALEMPLRGLAEQAPRGIAAARAKIEQLRGTVARLGVRLQAPPVAPKGRAGARADSAASATLPSPAPKVPTVGATSAPTASAPTASAPASGGSEGDAPSGLLSTAGRVFGGTAGFLGETIEVVLLAFFLLAAGTGWADKLGRALDSPERQRGVEQAVDQMRAVIARYVGVTVGINIGQGVVVGLAMWAIGLPSPALWGVLTAVFELVPYLGGFVMVALLALAGLSTGGSIGHALLAPAAYLLISTLQNNLVSPTLYGRGLSLNPAAILVSVMFWYALWGVAGALLAVPILAAARVLSEHVGALRPAGVFVGD